MKTQPFLIKCMAFAGFLLMTLGGAVAQKGDEDLNKTFSPYFVVVSEHPETDRLPLKETSVKTDIVGCIADVTVRQEYVNSGQHPIEAIYTFPMSTRAAVYGMRMTIGDRIITAKIEEKKKARADYEQAKQEGKRASLLEQSRPNVFTMNVSNIMVGDTIVVELNYTELLVPEKGTYSFVYPTVVGPRYSNKSKDKAGPDDDFVSTPYTHQGEAPSYAFGYELTIHSGIPIQDVTCTTHKVQVSNPDLKTAVVRLDPSERAGGNRDVVVGYSLQGNSIESGVMLYEGPEENYFLAMVQPPKRVQKENIPPREYVFIVDVSGSMWGFPMEITKKLMRNLIVNLNPTDKFNVVLFSSNLKVFSPRSVDATTENFERALKFIKSGNDWSGTEVLDALKKAYALPLPDEDMSRTFVIATDGYVDVERECFEMIRRSSGNTNFFAFGIGSGVNRYLIEGMAAAGGGEPFIVESEKGASKMASRFREYINTPVLTRIKLNTGSLKAYDIEPAAVPDMMAERPILVYGKYRGKATGTLTLSGNVGRKAWHQSFDLSRVKPDSANAALRYLWARERIKYLDYLVGPYAGDNDTTAKRILELGLKYNLMTNYTSFVAIDEVVVNKDGQSVRVKQALPLPEGVSDAAVGYDAGFLTTGTARGESGMVTMQGNVRKSLAARLSNEDIRRMPAIEEEVEEEDEETVFVIVEDSPEFPGGIDSLMAFLSRNIVYPELAKQNGIEGKVYVTFVVEVDGSLTDIKVLRDIGGGCGDEVVRALSLSPRWKPGRQQGKPVRVQFYLPVQFVLPQE